MRVLYITLGIILSDQISKLLIKGISIPEIGIAVKGYPLGTSIPVIGDFLRMTYIENPGMAFGIDIGGKLFLSILSLIASVGIIIYLFKNRNDHILFRISLAMILGGAVGNLIDRMFYGIIFGDAPLFYGKVVDFIDADFFNLNIFGYQLNRWPVFNIADASVSCGVILLLFSQRHADQKTEIVSPLENNSQAIESPAADIVPEHNSKQTDL